MSQSLKEILTIITAVSVAVCSMVTLVKVYDTYSTSKRHVLVRECIASNERIVANKTDRILSLQHCEDIK